MKNSAKRLRNMILNNYFRRINVGRNTHIDHSTHILGWRNIRIGSFSVLSEHVYININHRSDKAVQFDIGDRCFIGRRNFFNPGKLIRLADFVMTGPDCHFLGADHVFNNPLQPYISTGMTKDNIISIGANCWFGSSVTVVGNVEIGYGSVVGTRAVVTHSIPPFSLAIGFPAVVKKRYDFRSQSWVAPESFSLEMENAVPSEEQYLAILYSGKEVRPPAIAAGFAQGNLP